MEISAKELITLVNIEHKCNECIHYNGEVEALGKIHYMCKLSNALMSNNYACGLYNKDISQEHICYNCKNYLGGADWGLSCRADYHMLTNALNEEECSNFTNEKFINDEKTY